MTLLKSLLVSEPRIVSVAPTATILDAVQAMVKGNCGATIILDGDRPVGIFTERDLMKWVVRQEGSVDQVPVTQVMTADLMYAQPGDSISSAIMQMRKHHIRHLPIREEDGPLLGVLSIRDLIREEVQEMRNYIARKEG